MAIHQSLPTRSRPTGPTYARSFRSMFRLREDFGPQLVKLRPSSDLSKEWLTLVIDDILQSAIQSQPADPVRAATQYVNDLAAAISSQAVLNAVMTFFPGAQGVCRTDVKYVHDQELIERVGHALQNAGVPAWTQHPSLQIVVALFYLGALSTTDFVQGSETPSSILTMTTFNGLSALDVRTALLTEAVLYQVRKTVGNIDPRIPQGWLGSSKLTSVTLRSALEERISSLVRAFTELPQRLLSLSNSLTVALASVVPEVNVDDWETVATSSVSTQLRADWTIFEHERTQLHASGGLALARRNAMALIAPHMLERRLSDLGQALASPSIWRYVPITEIASYLGFVPVSNVRQQIVRVVQQAEVAPESPDIFFRQYTLFQNYSEFVATPIEEQIVNEFRKPRELYASLRKLQFDLSVEEAEQVDFTQLNDLSVVPVGTPISTLAERASALMYPGSVVQHVWDEQALVDDPTLDTLFSEITNPEGYAITQDLLPGHKIFFDLDSPSEVELLAALSGVARSAETATPWLVDRLTDVNRNLFRERFYNFRGGQVVQHAAQLRGYTLQVSVPGLQLPNGQVFSTTIDIFQRALAAPLVQVDWVPARGVARAMRRELASTVRMISQLGPSAGAQGAVNPAYLHDSGLDRLLTILLALPGVEQVYHMALADVAGSFATANQRRVALAQIKYSEFRLSLRLQISLLLLELIYNVPTSVTGQIQRLMTQAGMLRRRLLSTKVD